MLTAVAVLAAVAWRVELEVHGWDGLDWIGYFHWAIPLGVFLFFGWLYLFVPVSSKARRICLLLTAAVAGAAWFLVVQFALCYRFNAEAFVPLTVGERPYRAYLNLIYAVVPLTPLLFVGLLWAFVARPKLSRLALSIAIYLLACPISVGILAAVGHRGKPDALHAIKSGVIIPFLVAGLGVLVPNRIEGQQG